jgi:hypothetical protein
VFNSCAFETWGIVKVSVDITSHTSLGFSAGDCCGWAGNALADVFPPMPKASTTNSNKKLFV